MSNNTTTTNESSPPKIKVHFVPVGNAPLLKKSKFLISSTDEFGIATVFLRKLLKLTSDTTGRVAPLFLYIHSFVPSADQRMGDLMNCFGVRGELVVHYSLMEAWG
jgi:ubiquitin-like protein ATG12